MKHALLFIMLCFWAAASAQLNPGDLAFTAFNADADDDFALVTFVDIPANTTIYYTDSEWDGSAFGTDEGDFAWDTGSNVIPQGTVITFNTTGNIPSVSLGTMVGNTIALSASSEALFAFLGTAPRTPTLFLAAFANATGAYGSLNNTGLVEGFSAITFTNGTDIADYTGPRTGLDRDGYLLALNDMTNYDTQDGAGDQSNDGIVPDLPFDTTVFVVSTADLTPPSPINASVVDINTVEVIFSEEITALTAEDANNYSFSPSLTINSITYDTASNTATITHSGFNIGTAYVLTTINTEDLAGNLQAAPFISNDLFFNDLTSGLIITEIMYNAPGAGNNLEFVEIFNNSNNPIALGGLEFSDANSFSFVMPEQTLNAGDVLLLANNKTFADAFYGVSFIDLGLNGANAFGNGGEELKINNSTGQLIVSVTYDDVAPWPTQADGNGPSIELLDPNGNVNDGANWIDATNLVGPSNGIDIFASPGTFTPVLVTTPNIQFSQTITQAPENIGSITLDIEISASTANLVSFDVVLSGGFATANSSDDFTFSAQNLSFPANSTTPISISIPIIDDTDIESDELFSVEIANPTNATIGGSNRSTIYILDDDNIAPAATNVLGINYLTSYLVDASGSAEVLAHDPITERLFVVNSIANKLEVIDIADLNNISTIISLDLTPFGAGPNSVAVYNGLVAVAMESGTVGVNGQVVFLDTNAANPNTVTVGDLPDMLTFTPDGTKVLVANEAQPNDAYTVDPEGSVSIIDVTPGLGNITQANVTQVNFNSFDSDIANLRASGVRIFGPGASVSQDLEPEYITVSDDSQTAWISLQENNAIATLDIATASIT
ncbi:MAG: lamin tail domain-containing protein, partial [Flavobacteriaceae bacterium]|nr:lamin tail domain-containing protein [Flavobacteriaceae bacterium]